MKVFHSENQTSVKKVKMDMDSDDDDTSSSSSSGFTNDKHETETEHFCLLEPLLSTWTEDSLTTFNNSDPVIETILSLLPLRDLKTARKVSRRWNQFAAIPFHAVCSAAQICFCETPSVDSPWAPGGQIPHGIGDMAAFTQDVRARGTCSFRQFDLGASVMRKEGSTGVVSDFFSVCGPYIEELNVGTEDKQTELMYEQVLLTSPLPSLRALRVNVEYADAFLGDFFDFVGMIIQGSTNLESLTLRLDDLIEDQVTNCLIPSLRLCKLDKLVNLEIYAALAPEHFIALSGIQDLRLKRLSLFLWWNIEDSGPLRRFLESQSGSLEALRLSGSRGYVIEFPRMNNLKSLAVEVDDDCYKFFFTFPTLSYPQQFPSLETLIVPSYIMDLDDEQPHQLIEPDLRPCRTVQELVVRRTFHGAMTVIASRFPNVKRLEICLNAFPEVYSFMPDLEELIFGDRGAHYGDLIDDLITGIPKEECERIHREGNYDAVLRNLAKFQRRPSITCLKRLTKLKLDIKDGDSRGLMRISEASFHLALFHMESLKTLDLGSTDLTQISSDCMEAIRRRFHVKMKDTNELQEDDDEAEDESQEDEVDDDESQDDDDADDFDD